MMAKSNNATTMPGSQVRIGSEVGVDAMVAAFLHAEIGSTRFAATVYQALTEVGARSELVEHPDLADASANALRREVLAACRGFPDREVFRGVPSSTLWYQATLTPADLDHIRYIDWGWWLEVTAGTRRPADALHYYQADPDCRAIASAITAGHTLPPIILVARPGPIDLVVLEGHLRLTAMHLARRHLPPETPAIVGIDAPVNC